MNDDNPYAVSRECSGTEPARFSDQFAFQVIGDTVVCGPTVQLPPVCLATQATDDLVAVTQQTQFPSFRFVIVQRHCHVTYFLARRVQRRRRLMTAGWTLAAGVGVLIFLIGLGLVSPTSGAVSVVGILTLITAIGGLTTTPKPLTLVRYRVPGTYWIRGFSKAYLAAILKAREGGALAKVSETAD